LFAAQFCSECTLRQRQQGSRAPIVRGLFLRGLTVINNDVIVSVGRGTVKDCVDACARVDTRYLGHRVANLIRHAWILQRQTLSLLTAYSLLYKEVGRPSRIRRPLTSAHTQLSSTARYDARQVAHRVHPIASSGRPMTTPWLNAKTAPSSANSWTTVTSLPSVLAPLTAFAAIP
jgi:hypothetical protein